MLTSIIGFPRVGNLRELKFATEKYFKHQISQERLQTVAKERGFYVKALPNVYSNYDV